jgi:iron complex outermembrane receptor protein
MGEIERVEPDPSPDVARSHGRAPSPVSAPGQKIPPAVNELESSTRRSPSARQQRESKMTISRSVLLVSTALMTGLACSPALAQAGHPNNGASDNSAGNVAQQEPLDTQAGTQSGNEEEIVVTAEKREQTLIDVPQSVSVITGATLETQQANTFEDYLKLVPGLQVSQSAPGQARLVIRGLNTDGVASTVGVYEDETPFGSSTGLANGAVLAGDFDTFDVARIEVLRGPQGTLYGANALGGVLKFVTNAPETDRFIARARGGIETVEGGDLSYFGNAVVNVPLGDTLAFRASGTYRNTGGFIDSIGTAGSRVRNNINGSRVYGGRASLLFKPSADFSLRLSALVQNIDTDAPTVVESDPTTFATLYGRPTQSIFVSPYRDIKYRVYNATANLNLGFANLTSATSYSTEKQPSRTDATFQLSGLLNAIFGVPNELYLGQNTNLDKFTQEVRLASSKSPLLDWVIGGYYTHEKGLILQQYFPVTPGTLTPITAVPLLAKVNLASTYEEIAGFANATVHLGEHFDIDLGGRESHNKQSVNQVLAGALVGASTFTQHSSEDVFTYSVAPKLKLGQRASIYARVAKGFRPGGPNALGPGAPPGSESYRSDSVISYELGVKAESRDHKFSIEIAAFHIDWNNIQLLTSVTTQAGAFSFNTNGGRARSDGVEFTATVRPTQGLNISANGAYNNAYLKDPTTVPVGGFAGDKLPFTPKYSVSLNADYRWTLGGGTNAFIGGSLRYLSNQPGGFDAAFRIANGRQREIPSYEVVDLRAGLDFGKYSVEAYVRNLNNADGKTTTSPIGAYPNGAMATGVIRPRSIGLAITAGF